MFTLDKARSKMRRSYPDVPGAPVLPNSIKSSVPRY
jgi:hypothetical protein